MEMSPNPKKMKFEAEKQDASSPQRQGASPGSSQVAGPSRASGSAGVGGFSRAAGSSQTTGSSQAAGSPQADGFSRAVASASDLAKAVELAGDDDALSLSFDSDAQGLSDYDEEVMLVNEAAGVANGEPEVAGGDAGLLGPLSYEDEAVAEVEAAGGQAAIRGEAGVEFPFHLLATATPHILSTIINYVAGGSGSKNLVALSSTCSFFRGLLAGELRLVCSRQTYFQKIPVKIDVAYPHIGATGSEVNWINRDSWFGLSFLGSESLTLKDCKIHEGVLFDMLAKMPNLLHAEVSNTIFYNADSLDRHLVPVLELPSVRTLILKGSASKLVGMFTGADSLRVLDLSGSHTSLMVAHSMLMRNAGTLTKFTGTDYQFPMDVQFPVLERLELSRVVDASYHYTSSAPNMKVLILKDIVFFHMHEFLQNRSQALRELTLTTSIAELPTGLVELDRLGLEFPRLRRIHIINHNMLNLVNEVFTRKV